MGVRDVSGVDVGVGVGIIYGCVGVYVEIVFKEAVFFLPVTGT